MNCLVTGGAGFIGSHIATKLLENGHCVNIIDDFSTGKMENIKHIINDITLFKGSIVDEEILNKAMQNIDVVFHEAAVASVQKSIEDPLFTDRVNVFGTLSVFRSAVENGVKRVIYATSAAVYGDLPELPKTESTQLKTQHPYALHKFINERYGEIFYQLYGLENVGLRYFNVYGPKQDPHSPYSGVISIFINNYLNNQNPTIFGDGEQYRDFIYVQDVVQANLHAMKVDNPKNTVCNVCCSHKISLKELVTSLDTIFSRSTNPIYADARTGDIKESFGDNTKLKNLLRYTPKTDFLNGLKETVGWYKTTV